MQYDLLPQKITRLTYEFPKNLSIRFSKIFTMIHKKPSGEEQQLDRDLVDRLQEGLQLSSEDSSDESISESDPELEVLRQQEQAIRAHRDELDQQLNELEEVNHRMLEAVEDQELGILIPGHLDDYLRLREEGRLPELRRQRLLELRPQPLQLPRPDFDRERRLAELHQLAAEQHRLMVESQEDCDDLEDILRCMTEALAEGRISQQPPEQH